ncbi:hypothetical protein NQ318_019150 [Aromia moschata]|uniref:Uncharacterized protein n=1 Tax=Aromia moschata TaxID=1265417 RepID=A0AAV8YTA8_9CUCU|nr:hypothetical protein NQ318_019150 [Aromia moschata]
MSPLSQISQSSINSSPMMSNFDDMADSILDEIIHTQDINLLSSVYNHVDKEPQLFSQLRHRQVMAPSDFLRFAYTDLETHVNKRVKWISGMDDFGSLLDDILKEYNNENINSMDCY